MISGEFFEKENADLYMNWALTASVVVKKAANQTPDTINENALTGHYSCLPVAAQSLFWK